MKIHGHTCSKFIYLLKVENRPSVRPKNRIIPFHQNNKPSQRMFHPLVSPRAETQPSEDKKKPTRKDLPRHFSFTVACAASVRRSLLSARVTVPIGGGGSTPASPQPTTTPRAYIQQYYGSPNPFCRPPTASARVARRACFLVETTLTRTGHTCPVVPDVFSPLLLVTSMKLSSGECVNLLVRRRCC